MNDKSAKPVLYRVDPYDPAGHRLRVVMTVDDPDPAGQVLALPAWIPGSYLIRDFARQVETIRASCRAQPVRIQKIDNHAWRCAAVRGPLRVEYTVYAWDLSVRGAHFDETHAFFNGTSVFLAARGRMDRPCLVELLPPTLSSAAQARCWRVYTSLPEAAGHAGAAARHGFGWYRAPDYDALIDHPVEMGTPQVVQFTAHGALHELVFTGRIPHLDVPRLARDVHRICAAQIALFEPETRRAPFLDASDRYVFLVTATGDGYGGLEHRSSTALITMRQDLPTRANAAQTEGYRRFLGLVSHEYFHTWHVKRIKPAAFAPYDLWRENHTRLLWVFEGFTSYYDDLMLVRSGVVGQEDYLQLLADTITSVHRAPGRFKQSMADSSFDAWTRYYKQDENSPNALVSYYTKGALAALGLDLTIRTQTCGQKSLDDVMRLLWQRYGRDFYQGRAHGISEDAMPDLIHAATGVRVDAFLHRCVAACEDVPLQDLFAPHGVALTWEGADAPSLDVRFGSMAGGVHGVPLATVFEGGAAHAAGLSAGDALIALDGLRVQSPDDVQRRLRAYAPGDVVTVHVFRRDELRDYRVTLAAPPADKAVLRRVA